MRLSYAPTPSGTAQALRLTPLADPASAYDTTVFANETAAASVSGDRVLLLVRAKFMPDAQAFATELLGPAKNERMTLLQGDILELDLGLKYLITNSIVNCNVAIAMQM